MEYEYKIKYQEKIRDISSIKKKKKRQYFS